MRRKEVIWSVTKKEDSFVERLSLFVVFHGPLFASGLREPDMPSLMDVSLPPVGWYSCFAQFGYGDALDLEFAQR